MTQQDKELLLKDLCARLPYGVKILHIGWNYELDDTLATVERVVGIDENWLYTKVIDDHTGEEYREDEYPIDTFDDKLYLRPMSSMTEEEKADIEWYYRNSQVDKKDVSNCIDYFNSHYLDYRGLIEKGLALEAPKGMYRL